MNVVSNERVANQHVSNEVVLIVCIPKTYIYCT